MAVPPLRIGVTPPDPGVIRDMGYPFAIIGRDPRCEISLDNDSISRRHTLLLVLEGKIFGIDLGSREGTLWSDTARAYGWLDGDTALTVGPYRIQILRPDTHGSEATFNPMASWPRGRKNQSDLILELRNVPSRKSRWRIKSVVTMIGRSSDCKMRLMDPSVSSVHCCLICTPMGLWAIDLLGREGIEVNERTVRYARLADSDDLRVGRFIFRVLGEASQANTSETRPQQGTIVAVPALPWHGGNGSDSDAASGSSLPALNSPATPAYGISTTRKESAEGVLIPVVNALRMLQKHDQDQHHQTMMMLQTIFALHGEQIGTVRSQLDSVLQLLQEVRTSPLDPVLAARLAETAKAWELAAKTGLPGSKRDTRAALEPASHPSAQVYRLPGARTVQAIGAAVRTPSAKDEAGTSVQSPPSETKARPQTAAITSVKMNTKAERPSPAPQAKTAADLEESNATSPQDDKDPALSPEHCVFEDGMHSIIRDQLFEIRRERMTLWQKIIDMVGGS